MATYPYYIAPNSVVYLCRGVPLDRDHTKSYCPQDAVSQINAFMQYQILTLTAQSYTRASANSIIISVEYETVVGCNYMTFKNTSFENKYFFAFVDNVEYVNNNATRINFTLDDLQTWFFDFTFLPSWVEREHTLTDNIGDNIQPEPSLTGGVDYITQSRPLYLLGGFYTVILTSKDFLNPSDTYIYNTGLGNISAGQYNVINYYGGFEEATAAINKYIAAAGESGIIAMYDVPVTFLQGGVVWDTPWHGTAPNPDTSAKISTLSVGKPVAGDLIAGYKPRNNKLYTSPFNYFGLATMGRTKDFRYESFDGDVINFEVQETGVFPNPSALVYPVNYIGSSDDTKYYCDGITISGYPQSIYTTSEYVTAIGNSKYSMLYSAIASLVPTPKNILAFKSTAQWGSYEDTKRQTSIMGGTGSDYLATLTNQLTITLIQTTLDEAQLKVYDDYFDMYGYAVNRLTVPTALSDNHRPFYGYTKTKNASIISDTAPASAISNIASYFDSGICLWYDISNVGKYVLTNYPEVITA